MGRMLSCGALWLMRSHDSCVYLEVWTENAVARAKTFSSRLCVWKLKEEGDGFSGRGGPGEPRAGRRRCCGCDVCARGQATCCLMHSAAPHLQTQRWPSDLFLSSLFEQSWLLKQNAKQWYSCFLSFLDFKQGRGCSNRSCGSLSNFRSLPWC